MITIIYVTYTSSSSCNVSSLSIEYVCTHIITIYDIMYVRALSLIYKQYIYACTAGHKNESLHSTSTPKFDLNTKIRPVDRKKFTIFFAKKQFLHTIMIPLGSHSFSRCYMYLSFSSSFSSHSLSCPLQRQEPAQARPLNPTHRVSFPPFKSTETGASP
jgi:hypothetical protein